MESVRKVAGLPEGPAEPAGPRPAISGLPLAGAPLDAVKLAAAVFMLGDHVNTVLLQGAHSWMWRFGRIAFPLFCYVMACHLLRGADPKRYFVTLLTLAAGTQPVFAIAFRSQLGNILFTLAAGAAIALAWPRLPGWARHAVFALGPLLAYAAPGPAVSGVDFGFAGMLLPAAILAVLSGGWRYGAWLVVLLFTLNAPLPRPPNEAWWYGPLLDGVFAGLGGLGTVLAARLFAARPRFLPRYALHIFYPGHLAILAALRALL